MRSSEFPTRSDTNQAVQLQKMDRGLKFRIKEVEGLYYPYCENKGTDQLNGFRRAALRLCFHICKKSVLMTRLIFCRYAILKSPYPSSDNIH